MFEFLSGCEVMVVGPVDISNGKRSRLQGYLLFQEQARCSVLGNLMYFKYLITLEDYCH